MPYTENGTGFRRTDTSLDAAKKVEKSSAPMRTRVLAVLMGSAEGMTAQEIAEALGLKHYYGMQPRLSELKRKGLIEDSGKRRELPSGNKGIVWRCT